MPDSPALSCRLCRHWAALADITGGECRLHAPALVAAQFEGMPTDHPARRVFPLTHSADWCGEWAASPARVAEDLEAVEAKGRRAVSRLETKLKAAVRSLEIARGNPAPGQAESGPGENYPAETVTGGEDITLTRYANDTPPPDDAGA